MDFARERFADAPPDFRLRLKRLRIRAESLQRQEAVWAVAGALDGLFAAAEVLLPEAAEHAPSAEALEQICVSIGELLDAVDPG
jgi:hypothetical protein